MTLFEKIVAREVPATIEYEDDDAIVLRDVNPQAPVHLLVIPKEHVASAAHTAAEHTPLLGHLVATAAKIAREQGLGSGYRIVINTGADGGQTVDHLHLHVLGGRHMGWPPG